MKRAAVLGSPIKHSLSPLIHNAAYRKLGVHAEYEACEVSSDDLSGFLESKMTQNEWMGFSLTMPLKEKVCEIARSFGIELDSQASRINSANTVYREGAHWRATSTDVSGFSFLLRNRKFESATIFGAGGTARAAIEALDTETAITIVLRNARREAEIQSAFPQHKISFMSWKDFQHAWSHQLVIIAVPINAIADLEDSFRAPELLIDVLYSPWIPPISLMQMNSGKKLFTGIDLLCAQALGQIRFMTGTDFDDQELFAHLKYVAEEYLSKS